ncbi:histidine kinase [Gardnerella vaginalis]|uniref:Sensor-like histidine kinase SenX3 n=1 Tax=Gardnerella vaginalis TaxID=2702 RepID=A0A3E1J0V4_GARVA|nr:ATP-binding protein [Gardnerella vaginalis]RFD79954.1 histidine kinase [Gardnerella vaginalis]
MPQDSSAVVFIAFGVLALCVVLALVVLMSDWLLPCLRRVLRGVSGVCSALMRIFGGLIKVLRLRSFLKSADSGDAYDSDNAYDSDVDGVSADDVSSDAAQVLAMLQTPTIVIDADNDVVRASSEAYLLGVVSDDSLAQPRVLQAVNSVRASGGFERFTMVTDTPERYVTIGEESSDYSSSATSATSSATSSNASSTYQTTVSRPNWLTVTVGSVGRGMVVVVIEDTSASRRFAQTRDDFIANVSEQLMSSTRTIANLTKVLQSENVTAQKVKDIARIAGKSSERLEHIMEDLMWLLRAQSPIDVTQADVLSIDDQLVRVQQQVASFAATSKVRVVVKANSSLRVRGDAEQVCAAVRKLVENAIAYSPANSVVAVSAELSSDGQYAVIRVVDSGVGIDVREQPRVFERFYRAHNQNNRSQDGVGLGLAIAKHVALTHRGNITLWSRPGQGTTVSFALPLLKN